MADRKHDKISFSEDGKGWKVSANFEGDKASIGATPQQEPLQLDDEYRPVTNSWKRPLWRTGETLTPEDQFSDR